MKPNSMNKTFETFMEDSSNRFALAACKSILNNGETFNSLTIYGPSGLGKTHLLMAIKRSAETACSGEKQGTLRLNSWFMIIYRRFEMIIRHIIDLVRNALNMT